VWVKEACFQFGETKKSVDCAKRLALWKNKNEENRSQAIVSFQGFSMIVPSFVRLTQVSTLGEDI
jgi:hypothetical protein